MKYAFALCLASAPLAAQVPDPGTPPPPLTLRALFDSVAATHPLVRAAQSRTRAAQGSRITAGALGNPVLSYQVDRMPLASGQPSSGDDREIMTTVTFPLEAFYQRWPRVQAADAIVRAAQADADLARQRIALEAADSYYRTAFAQVGVSTARDLLAWLDTLVAYNRARVEEGAAAEADLVRAELERDRAAADATMQEVELARARATLAAFLGEPRRSALATVMMSNRPLALAGDAGAAFITPPALDRRPDVRAARSRADASRAGVTTERALIVRQFGATIGAKRMAGNTSLVAGLSIPLPLVDVNRGQIRRASAERDAALFDLAAAERAASADLAGAQDVARLLTARTELLTAGRNGGFLARAEEARRIALGAYREGAVPLLTVLDAARAWGDARATFYRTLYAQHQSVLVLLAAQGIDLFTHVPATAEPVAPNR
ncbi:MAG TPA: TolC family protein [Gemmatimonadaceae bacterium]|nr:TolC family protein [Gemmatimonadaceae bacterium]